MAVPKIVLTPGMETGIRKTRDKNTFSSKSPSFPIISLISDNVTLSGGNCPMITLIVSVSGFVYVILLFCESNMYLSFYKVMFPAISTELFFLFQRMAGQAKKEVFPMKTAL